jgi:hypothetical protein
MYIPNQGSVTITNLGTGVVAFQQPLSFDGCDTCPVAKDNWTWDMSKAAPGVYSVCGLIEPGSGFEGWQECQTYANRSDNLLSLQRGYNTSHGFILPLSLDPGLIGQTIQITVQAARWNSVPYAVPHGWVGRGWTPFKTVGSYSLTPSSGQEFLSAGRHLGDNSRIKIAVTLPEIPTATQQSGSSSYDGAWFLAGPCSTIVHGRVTKPLSRWASASLRRRDFIGKQHGCARPMK